ncbi:MAG: type II secretion system F family protein [Candidatus Alcyoniella australis]|nr:type II secretion system F family protein [Candidatus Alcyoniella australis]
MPVFKWEGKSRTGAIVKGEMDAPNDEAVIAKLRSQQIMATKVKAKPKDIQLFSFGQKVKEQEVVVFTRQFATMIDAGLPLVQCLEILVSQQENKTFAQVLAEIKADVEAGSTFARALGKHPKVFDDLFVALVAAGEVGGILDTIMNRLGAYIEKSMKLKKRVKGALAYPAAVTGVAVLVVVIMLVWVIPVFENMFKDFGHALPGLTQFFVDFSHGIRDYWFILIPLIIGIVVAIRYALQTEKGRETWDKISLRLPVFGPLLQKQAVAKFTRTLGTMITSGVPILDGLDIVAKTSGNKVIEKAVLTTKDRIAEGKTIAEPLAESGVFPGMVVQMITVGESTGALDVMLAKIADFYEDEVDMAVETLMSLIEPIMMVVLGGTVGTLMIAMYLPIFKLVSVMD